MARKLPSEFAGFIRDAGVRAVDRLSDKANDLPAPIRALLRAWNKLSADAKHELFEELIATVMIPGQEPKPARKRAAAKKKKAPAKK